MLNADIESLVEVANSSGIDYRHIYGDVALNDFQSRKVANPNCPLCNGTGMIDDEFYAPYGEQLLAVPVINQCECVEESLLRIHEWMESEYE